MAHIHIISYALTESRLTAFNKAHVQPTYYSGHVPARAPWSQGPLPRPLGISIGGVLYVQVTYCLRHAEDVQGLSVVDATPSLGKVERSRTDPNLHFCLIHSIEPHNMELPAEQIINAKC
jgi:hypothetical protein